MDEVTLRRYEERDAEETLGLFLRAIRVTAAAHYTPEQLAAWSGAVDPDAWAARRAAAETWVAELDGAVVGFTDLDSTGYVDMLFVDPSAGRRGVAAALLDRVRALARARGLEELTANVSLTARPVFERHGFEVVAEQRVERNGSVLTNYRMAASLR